MSRFARKLGCTPMLLAGKEFTAGGVAAAPGDACASCGDGCSRGVGEIGLAAQGVTILHGPVGALGLRWRCPRCGCDVHEETTALGAADQAHACLADPLCVNCRRGVDHVP